MTNPRLRAVSSILSCLLMASVPVQAGPVVISDVIQVVGNLQTSPELRLNGDRKSDGRISTEFPATSKSTPANGVPGSLFAGIAIIPDFQNPSIEQIRSGSVEGTVCDCGELIIAGGGFPKWPLLFLAGVPLFFIHPNDDIEIHASTQPLAFVTAPTPPATAPTPPATAPIPEPVSLLLLGTGLAACGVRLRRRKIKNLLTKNQTN